jgi:hypothetical protein
MDNFIRQIDISRSHSPEWECISLNITTFFQPKSTLPSPHNP